MPEWLQLFALARFGRPLVLLVGCYSVLWILTRVLRSLALPNSWRSRELSHPASRGSAAAIRVLFLAVPTIALIAFVCIAVWYASDQRYFDFAEPTMPAVAWMFESGNPLYPGPDAAERYAHIYGPMAFIPLAAAMRIFGTDLRVAKWVAAGAAIIALSILWLVLRGRVGARTALIITGCCALLLLVFRNAAFWVRPDSLELLCAAAGLWAALRRDRVGWLVLGVTAGVLCNLKFSGPLYALPLFVLFLERTDRRRVLLALAVSGVVVSLPFLVFHNISFREYGRWILLSSRNGIVWSTLRQNIEWVLYLMTPLAVAVITSARHQPLTVVSRPVAISVGIGLTSIAVLASKPGAGPYHLLPFLPLLAFLTGMQIHHLRLDGIGRPGYLFNASFSGAAVLIALAQQASFIATVRQLDAVGPLADVAVFLAQHRDGVTQVGYSSDERATFVRPVVVGQSRTYLLDQPAIQEHQLAGVEIPKATEDALRSCAVTYWLVPKTGAPFTAINRYPMMNGRPLFGSGFRRAFFESYRRSDSTRYFDVWTCR